MSLSGSFLPRYGAEYFAFLSSAVVDAETPILTLFAPCFLFASTMLHRLGHPRKLLLLKPMAILCS